jgi:membrane protease YdiL (CAAX protease family)
LKSNTFLIAGYFFVRIIVSNIINFSSIDRSAEIGATINLALYTICILLIINNRSNLLSYNINKSTIIILIISGFFQSITKFDSLSVILQLLFITDAIWLWVLYRKKRLITQNLRGINIWSIIGVLLLFPLVFALIYIHGNLPDSSVFSKLLSISTPKPSTLLIFNFIYFLCTVGFEETVFRGFLWGYLREFKISEMEILFITSGIFWISHINYLSHSWTFWIQLPIISLYLGFLAYKSKMSSPSIFAHAFYNTLLIGLKGILY